VLRYLSIEDSDEKSATDVEEERLVAPPKANNQYSLLSLKSPSRNVRERLRVVISTFIDN